MSEEVTRGEIEDIIRNFAAENSEYRQALLDNPAEVLSRQMGAEVPAGVNVKVVEETADTIYLVAPYCAPGEGSELYRGLGAVVVGGLSMSAFLTLLTVPPLLRLCVRAPAEDEDKAAGGVPAE